MIKLGFMGGAKVGRNTLMLGVAKGLVNQGSKVLIIDETSHQSLHSFFNTESETVSIDKMQPLVREEIVILCNKGIEPDRDKLSKIKLNNFDYVLVKLDNKLSSTDNYDKIFIVTDYDRNNVDTLSNTVCNITKSVANIHIILNKSLEDRNALNLVYSKLADRNIIGLEHNDDVEILFSEKDYQIINKNKYNDIYSLKKTECIKIGVIDILALIIEIDKRTRKQLERRL